MRINVHAGHNPDGKVACGAIGFIRESTENRRVKDAVIDRLRQIGHTVYDCTCDNGTNSADNLAKIVKACNAHEVDLDVSIHFNAGAKDAVGNGQTTGVEVYTYKGSGIARECAERVCSAVASLGFKNRGAKINNFYILRNTKAPAMLIECCFVDDKDDVELYDCQKMADAIVFGITGQMVDQSENTPSQNQESTIPGAEVTNGDLYRVQVVKQYGAFHIKDNAKRMQEELLASGFDAIIVKA